MKTKSDTDWKRLESLADKDIDFSDIPELDEAFFKEAEWHPPIKQPITIRLDADVLEWFRSQGPGYQTRINRLLRRYMEVNQQRNWSQSMAQVFDSTKIPRFTLQAAGEVAEVVHPVEYGSKSKILQFDDHFVIM